MAKAVISGTLSSGGWRVVKSVSVVGEGLSPCDYVSIDSAEVRGSVWCLEGTTSNLRYTTQEERSVLTKVSEPLGRAECSRAVLIPIRKSLAWWSLAQDERRQIYDRSKHLSIGT